ncbi:MAG: ComEA family DNA-binding protein [Solirubrobacteraceae bacterium]
MRTRSHLAMALVAATFGVLATDAVAQEDGQFSITPARRDLSGKPPTSLGATTVSNTTDGVIKVKVFPALLTQGIDGAFDVQEDPRELREAGLILSATPTDFTLQPGTNQKVSLRWNLLPRTRRAVFLGIVFQGIQLNQQNQPVSQINRLVSVTFLRLPGKYKRSGKITGLRGEQAGPRKLRFLTRVKNTGELVDQPRQTQFAIRDAGGDVVFHAKWFGDIILPDAEREFPVDVKKVLPKGDYTAISKMRFGTTESRVEKPFTLVGPNELPTTSITVKSLTANAVLGEDVITVSNVLNAGTQAGDVTLSLTLQRLRGATLDKKPLGAKRLDVTGVKPGEARPVKVTFPPVPAGRYRATLRYRNSSGELQTLTADFEPTAPADSDESGSFFSDNLPWILPLAGLLALLLLLALRRRRRKDEPEPEPAIVAPVAPAAPPAAATPGVVDINTASLEELQTLPGVGPKAAARIVEHREEYGRFDAVDGLLGVEGFTQERIDALRERVRV